MEITNKHYDLDASLFFGFLDPYMKYSSGLFDNNQQSLTYGINNMLNEHIKFLAKYDNPKILEIGSGWGSLAYKLTQTSIPFEYTAVNPSKIQNSYFRNSINMNYTLIEDTFENYCCAENQFDISFMIGSFCHIREKSQQIKRLYDLLTVGGRLIVEDTFFLSNQKHAKHANRDETKFVQNDIFGFAEITSLSEFVTIATDTGFLISLVLDHSSSYSKTIKYWLDNLQKMSSQATAESFIKYLEIAQKGWHHTIGNYLIELVKV